MYGQKSYLYGSSQDYGPEFYQRSYLSPDYSSSAPVQSEESAPSANVAGMSGMAASPFMATPEGAAAMVGSQFLSQYLAQKAADEKARRDRAAQIAEQHSQGEQKGFDTLMQAYRGALR